MAGFDGLPRDDMFDTSIFIITWVGGYLRVLPARESCEAGISLRFDFGSHDPRLTVDDVPRLIKYQRLAARIELNYAISVYPAVNLR